MHTMIGMRNRWDIPRAMECSPVGDDFMLKLGSDKGERKLPEIKVIKQAAAPLVGA
jgi:hypothetical protein